MFVLKLLEGEGLEAVIGGTEVVDKEPPPASAPEEKRPALSLEELEAKQGELKKIAFKKKKRTRLFPALL